MSLTHAIFIVVQVFLYSYLLMAVLAVVVSFICFLKYPPEKKQGVFKDENKRTPSLDVYVSIQVMEYAFAILGYALLALCFWKIILKDPSYPQYGISSCLFFIQHHSIKKAVLYQVLTLALMALLVMGFFQINQVMI